MRERKNPSLLLPPFPPPFRPTTFFTVPCFPYIRQHLLQPPFFFHENFFPPHLLSFPLAKPGLINRGGKGSNLLFQSVCFYASLKELLLWDILTVSTYTRQYVRARQEFFNLRNIGRRVSPTFKDIKKFVKPIYPNFWLSQVLVTNGGKKNFFSFHLPINQFLCRFPASAPVFPASEKGKKTF